MVKETSRTLFYIGIAVVSIGIAYATHMASRPKPMKEFEKVGTPFFTEDFDPNSAKSLLVASYDEDSATISEFRVEYIDGKWVIPSHHNYPADAQDRLAKTAASVIGLTRDALISRVASDQKRYHVLDPLSDDNTELDGRGSRITIKRADGTVLTDLIIGKEIDDRDDHYYVRHPDEVETYISKVELDLSTNFSDWIEQDLLKVNRGDLRDIFINKYSIDEVQQRIVGQEVNHLSKTTASEPWKLEGIDDTAEEINTGKINTMVGNLDDLKIVGVRPKPQGLNPDLSLSPQVQQNPLLRQSLLGSLASAGFFLAKDQNGNPVMVSNEGEMTAGTKEGVVYNIRFGQIFTGSTKEVETGLKKKSGEDSEKKEEDSKDQEEKDKKAETEKKAEESPENKEEESKEENDDKKNRYIFISVTFDPELIGPPPVRPNEPEKPAEDNKEEGKKEKDEEKGKEEKKEGEPKPEEKEDKPEKDPQKEYEEAMKAYEAALKKFEADMKKYEASIEAGKKRVEDLNRRFANWYYVISDDSFADLRLSRDELVQPKEKKEGSEDTPEGLLNPATIPTFPTPGKEKKAAPVKPEEKKEAAKPEEKKPEDKKPESPEKESAQDSKPKEEKPAEPAADKKEPEKKP